MVKTWGYLMSTSDQPWAEEWCTASTLSRWSFTFTFVFFLLSFNWNLRSSFTLISGIFLSTPDTPSCSHPTSLPLLLPKLPLFAFDSATSHSGFAFFVNSPYSSPPSTLLFFSVYLSCIFNAFETFKSLLVQLDFKIKQLSSVCVGWEGMMRREGLQCMRWQDQAFILDVWGVFERVRGKKDTEQTIHMNIQQIIKYMNQLMTQISACTQTYSFLVNRDQCITQSITLEAFQEIKGMDSLCIAFSIW